MAPWGRLLKPRSRGPAIGPPHASCSYFPIDCPLYFLVRKAQFFPLVSSKNTNGPYGLARFNLSRGVRTAASDRSGGSIKGGAIALGEKHSSCQRSSGRDRNLGAAGHEPSRGALRRDAMAQGAPRAAELQGKSTAAPFMVEGATRVGAAVIADGRITGGAPCSWSRRHDYAGAWHKSLRGGTDSSHPRQPSPPTASRSLPNSCQRVRERRCSPVLFTHLMTCTREIRVQSSSAQRAK